MEEDIIWIDNKPFRKGYTTGSCATAAAKVAAMMALRQELISQVSIITPSGVTLDLDVLESSFGQRSAIAAIRKDGGDDIDVTHGMLIFATVTLNDSGNITVDGGQGVGRVTRKGVRHEIGAAAINETPRSTIEYSVREVIGAEKGADIVIFAPEGVERAQQTFNPRLGIMGGISILGTTGIVTPMSDESWKRSITLEIEMKQQEGVDRLIFVPGNYGECFAQELGMNPKYVVVMSNFVRHVLKDAERLGFKQVLLLGHFGKLVKVAAGIFHTHSHIADGRIETLLAHLALMGAPQSLLQQVDACKTTEAAMELINTAGYQDVYNRIAIRIKERAEQLSYFTKNPMRVEAITFSMDRKVIGASAPVAEIIKEFAT